MRTSRWLPGLPAPSGFLVFLALLVALGPGLPRMFGSDGDVGRHIRVGQGILSKHEIPTADSLSHTRYGERWIPKEWLSQVALAETERLGGLPGVATLAALLFAAAVGMTYANARLLGGTLGASLGLATVSMLLQLVHLLPRPHLATTAFSSLLLFVLIQYRRTGLARWALAVPPMFLLWVNSHGGFPIGLVLVTLFWLDTWLGGTGPMIRQQKRMLTVVLLLAVAATVVNPVGPGIWSHVTGHLANDFFMDITEEFRSPDFHAPWGKLLLIVILGVAVLLKRAAAPLPWLGLAILLGTIAATLVSARHIALFATLGLPWLAMLRRDTPAATVDTDQAEASWPEHPLAASSPELRAATNNVVSVIAIAILILLTNGRFAPRAQFDPATFPVRALGALPADQLTGAVFNEMEWGGYLLYAYPEVPIFIDGHADFFGEEVVREYLAARYGGPEWSNVLDRYEVQWTVTRSDAPLNQLLELSENWELVLDDGLAAVYARTTIGGNAAEG